MRIKGKKMSKDNTFTPGYFISAHVLYLAMMGLIIYAWKFTNFETGVMTAIAFILYCVLTMFLEQMRLRDKREDE